MPKGMVQLNSTWFEPYCPDPNNPKFGIGDEVYVLQPIGRPQGTVVRTPAWDTTYDDFNYLVEVEGAVHILAERQLMRKSIDVGGN